MSIVLLLPRARTMARGRVRRIGRSVQSSVTFAWVLLCTGRQKAVLVRVCGERRARREAELAEDVAHMPSDRLLTDDQLRRDRAVRLSRRHERQDLELAWRESVRSRRPGSREGAQAIRVPRGMELLEHRAGRIELHLRR